MHIGILEDETDQQELYKLWLSSAQHTCSCYVSVREFVAGLQRERFDLLIIDWMLPESSGEVALKWLRENLGWDIPVIFVTARDAEIDIVTALKAGADDYLVKPPRPMEFLTRLEVLARRIKVPPATRYGAYEIDYDRHSIAVNDEPVELTRKEFDLACHLFQHPGKLLSRVNLLEQIWGLNADVDTRTVDTHISRLRRKLAIGPEHGWQIISVHGWGYRFEKTGQDGTEVPTAIDKPLATLPPASPLRKFLPLPGIDIADGLERTLGNEKLYIRMLVKFRDGQRDFAEQFAAARSDSNPETNVRVAHDLKSNAGNIGAKGVQLAAAKLEVACMESVPAQQIDTLLNKVLAELAPAIEGLAKVVAGTATR